jgi:4-amino-4-deoxy-L-arabinose transferase-like glycosyltransferase
MKPPSPITEPPVGVSAEQSTATTVEPVPETAAERPPRRPPFPMPWWTLFAVTLPALFLRILNIGIQRNYIDDSYLHVTSGFFYLRDGWLGPDSWWSPPLKHILMGASIALFGDNEVGWRMRGVVFGTAVVVLTFLLARRAFRRPGPAITATVLLALDPLAISLGHTTHEDIPAVFFVLLGLIFFLRGLEYERDWEWFASAACFGAGCALRWFSIVPLVVVALAAIWSRRDRIGSAISAAAIFSATSLAVYLATYLPWSARGNSPWDWVLLAVDSFRIQGPSFSAIPSGAMGIAGANRWFTSWVVGGGAVSSGPASVQMSLLLNDPLLWALFLPSAIYLLVIGIRRHRLDWVVLASSFLATYGFFLVSPRPILLYSAMAIVPLGYVMVGFAAAHLLRQRWPVFLAVATVWSLYLIPLVVHVSNPLMAYQWILAKAVQ